MKPTNLSCRKYFFHAVWLLATVLCFQTAKAGFTFPVYEPFAYADTEQLGGTTSGVNWTQGSTPGGSSSVITNTAALSYPGLPLDPTSPPLGLRTTSTATSVKYRHAPFTSQSSGTVYCSFLLSIPSLTNQVNTIIMTLSSSGSSSTAGGASVWLSPQGKLQLAKNTAVNTGPSTVYSSAATNTAALAAGSTYLVVMSYKFNTTSSSDDEVDLWLNPTSLGNNGAVPAPTLSVTNGADVSSLQSLFFYQAIANLTFYVDEIRVDNNWAGVTPVGPSPGPLFSVTGGGAGCPGDSFLVGLSGSVTTNVYLLYTNSTPTGQTVTGTGSAISFGLQSVSGVYAVLASNTVSGNVGWMNGNATVSVLAGPTITTEPASVLVATNGYATFSVAATGDGLYYQWYKNGAGLSDGGHITGSQTATLTISPATTADAATTANGYSVIITNNCGLSAVSSPNAALTLEKAANLVWEGGNPNTNWDQGVTANWNNGSGLVVFNTGDNVTLDDSSPNQVITVSGNVAPGSINENSSLAYAIRGNSIVGTGALTMNGSGSLTFSNVNSFSGGTTINSGGTVKMANYYGLGTGTVTLSGGTLDFPVVGSATVGLPNNVNVAANSTLQFEPQSTYGAVLNGGLSGNAGATLTINLYNNNPPAVSRLRFYGVFTNNAKISLNTYGTGLEVASYNTNGSQVFNGLISGNGHLNPRGNGNTILNDGANTFVDTSTTPWANYSVVLSGGNLGIGADSTASTPPTIDSSPVGTGILAIDVSGGNDSMFASGGAHTIANPIIYTSTTNTIGLTLNGSNNLTLAGTFNLSGADGTGATNRTLQVNNTALTTISGVICDTNTSGTSLVCGLTKTGTNTLVLSAINTYTGPTLVGDGRLWVNGQIDVGGVTVTNGTLGGSGAILSAVSVQSPGRLAPGTASLGTLTINSDLTLAGSAIFKVNKSLTPSNDVASVSGVLSASGTGTLTVSNLGPTLVVGDKFYLFNKAVTGGNALTVGGAGMNWTNRLAVDGSIQVLSVASTIIVPTNPPAITNFSLAGANVVISGTNGQSGATYYLLATTNLTTPRSQWKTVATNVLGTANNYTFIGTNAVVLGSPQRFYMLSSTNYNP